GTFPNVHNSSQNYLLPGIQILNVSLNTAGIYTSRTNVSSVTYIILRFLGEYQRHNIDERNNLPLSRTYQYNEFDPFAFFTGVILDEGIDEDADSLYDYLQIGVEINVTDSGHYIVEVMNLLDNGSVYLNPSSIEKDFEAGTHLLNFTVYGPRIYAARVNPTYIEPLRLYYGSGRGLIL
ncbi:MAG: hypothetical protein GWO20_14435, partial [Candidatus Korarchaeota archaeon]|nr:hypothetical protein [Candidatus Korarchaeota archaeon]NIW52941.1 hypothetical protein [Candidatus Korarchaeota archaeon]